MQEFIPATQEQTEEAKTAALHSIAQYESAIAGFSETFNFSDKEIENLTEMEMLTTLNNLFSEIKPSAWRQIITTMSMFFIDPKINRRFNAHMRKSRAMTSGYSDNFLHNLLDFFATISNNEHISIYLDKKNVELGQYAVGDVEFLEKVKTKYDFMLKVFHTRQQVGTIDTRPQ